jgi:CheY-like chemotaxis protein
MAIIFLVDDDLASELLAENLRQRGHEVARFRTVDEALSKIDEMSKADLVVLDLIMPSESALPVSVEGFRSSGMLVYRELRKRTSKLPILIVTANQDLALMDVIAADPAARYVSRWSGLSFREFIQIVSEMLGLLDPDPAPRAFIVHGHDDKTKLSVKNYLQNSLHLPEPMILHEQPNQGRTIIEKFEDLANTAELVFVLLTPDDLMADAGAPEGERRRARQNVIFELGFFLGALGRRSGRVFLLYKGPLDLPSDLSGVVYMNIEHGIESIGEEIRRELQALFPLRKVGR